MAPGEETTPGATPPAPAPAEETTTPGSVEPSPTPAPVHTNTMRVSGKRLLDACGQPFVVRGVEQILGDQLPQGLSDGLTDLMPQ